MVDGVTTFKLALLLGATTNSYHRDAFCFQPVFIDHYLEAETKCAVLVVVIRIHVLCNYTYIIWLMLIEGVLFRGEQ